MPGTSPPRRDPDARRGTAPSIAPHDQTRHDTAVDRLTEVDRAARRDTRALAIAGSLCIVMLLVVLSWASLTVRSNLGWVLGVVAVTFGLCLWLVHRRPRDR